MVGKVFSSVEVTSSMILGGATIGAAALNLLHEARRAKRIGKDTGARRSWLRRPLLVLVLSAVIVGVWVAYSAGALQAIPRLVARQVSNATAKEPTATKPATGEQPAVATSPAPTPGAAQPGPVTPAHPGKLEDWLQAEGTKIYYRYTKYLPDACPGSPYAIGNWQDGESRPVPARCVDGGWLALDLGPLVLEGRIVPNMTYCMNFRASSGAWGIHVPEAAPGLDSVSVPAVRVPLGRAIGVRYTVGSPRERVIPTAETPRAAC